MMNDDMGSQAKARLGDSVFLTKEEFAAVKKAVIETPVQDNVMLTSFPLVQTDNPYQKVYTYTKMDKYGTATESEVPGDAEALEVDGTEVVVKLPFYHLDYVINKFDENQGSRLGSLAARKATATARKVNDLMDTALFAKTSIFGTLGMNNLFTGSGSAAGVWSGATAEAIFADVLAVMKTVPAAYYSEDFRLHVEHVNYMEMAKVNAYGLSALKLLRESFPRLQIVVNRQQTHGTITGYPYREDVAHIASGFPLSDLVWESKPFEERHKVMRSGRLIVVAATAGVKMTGA